MKVEVIKKFIDKHTNAVRKVGDIIDVTQERYDEIKETGEFVKEVDAETVKGHLVKDDLETWKKDDLVKLAGDMGLETTGTKAEIIERIVAEEVEAPAEE